MIESAKPEDAPAIAHIAKNAGVFSPNELASVSEMLGAFFNPGPDDDFLFIVSRDALNGIDGFACFGPIPFTDRSWDLYWICVERRRQRNGVGTKLIHCVSEHLRASSARAIYLETSESDAYLAARAFYEREGFERVALLPDYYAPSEGKVIYRRVFP